MAFLWFVNDDQGQSRSIPFLLHRPATNRQIHTDNGRHERMYRDLKGEATRIPVYTLRAQQRTLNRFVYVYNNERPHAALEVETPESVHMRSRREYSDKVEGWIYRPFSRSSCLQEWSASLA